MRTYAACCDACGTLFDSLAIIWSATHTDFGATTRTIKREGTHSQIGDMGQLAPMLQMYSYNSINDPTTPG